MNVSEFKSKLVAYWSSAGIFLIFAMALTVRSGYSYGATLLLLGALVMLACRSCGIFEGLDKADKYLLATFVIYGLSFILFRFVHVIEAAGFDKPSRFVIGVVLYLFLRRYPFKINWLWYGIAMGTIAGVMIGGYERFVEGFSRAQSNLHPIMFGDISMLLGLLSLTGILYFKALNANRSIVFMMLGSVSGIFASILSGSRGGWIALPVAIIYIFWQGRELLGKKQVRMIFAGSVLLAVAVGCVPQLGVSQRIEEATSNIQNYVSGHNENTSVGMRFQMWKAALYMFSEHPVLGVGKYDLRQYKQQLADQGIIDQAVVHFGHAHNEYLTNLSEYGAIGFILLLLVYLVPMRLFAQKVIRYRNHWQLKSLAMAGVLVPASFMDFALTQSLFSHNSGVMIYILAILIIWAAIRNQEILPVKE
ncbi:O-antigen ligase [Celerinatantimonas diazotrophica]|uniref:O-antigen ligase n=2 Tax=Celerinatantimonas diazotrophica TaxID=412034 RepID=A0A4R1J9S1_9GAMM|nr:O-antigen ligase [Celerinatantimonas diazotrophica]CAG9296032.1 hypothetical protein CEDIAZO_01171 [Celerinatantimonas diazotrophica]